MILLFICIASSVFAQTEKDEQKKLRELKEQIKHHEEKLSEIKRYETSILEELDRLGLELSRVERDLAKHKSQLNETNLKISSTKREISRLESRINERKGWLKKKLRAIYRYGNFGDTFLLLGSSENVSQLMRRIEYLERIARSEQDIIKDFKQELSLLAEKETALEELGRIQSKQETEVKSALERLSERKKQKVNILASVKHEKAMQVQLIKELDDASKKLIEIIRQSEIKETILKGNFRELKGKLPWPITGELAIPYGRQKDPQFNTTIFRNGIYIKTLPDSIAKAVNAGKVVYADSFKGYGRLVILNHGNGYHSLYGNLSEIFLKVGDIIKKEDTIGKAGESVMTDSTSLYFEIRYKGKPLDPMQWLSRR